MNLNFLISIIWLLFVVGIFVGAFKTNGMKKGRDADAKQGEPVSIKNKHRTYQRPEKTATERARHYDSREAMKYSAYDHDTAHRLEQLDGFLKNGIVDKAEYNLLKERYLKGE